MRVRKIIPALFALLMPMGAMAQEEYPDVSPTATYTDTEGNPAESDKDNTQIAGQAPLSVNFYANPTGMGDYIPNYEWHFRRLGETKDFMVRYEENTDYTFNDAGTTMVTLRTTLNNGEIELDSVSFNVVISVSTLLFPNAFSPNGDEDNPIFKAKEYRSMGAETLRVDRSRRGLGRHLQGQGCQRRRLFPPMPCKGCRWNGI